MSRFYDIKPKQKPRWYQLRFQLANRLVRLAKWIHPQNPEVLAFYQQGIMDMMIYGKHITRVAPEEEVGGVS